MLRGHPSPVSDRGYSTLQEAISEPFPSHFPGEEGGQSIRNLLQCFPNLHLSEPRRHNIAAWPLKGRGIAQQPPSVWTSPRPWPPGPGVSVHPVPGSDGNGNANCQEATRTYSETSKIRNPIRPRRPFQPALRASPERPPRLGHLGRSPTTARSGTPSSEPERENSRSQLSDRRQRAVRDHTASPVTTSQRTTKQRAAQLWKRAQHPPLPLLQPTCGCESVKALIRHTHSTAESPERTVPRKGEKHAHEFWRYDVTPLWMPDEQGQTNGKDRGRFGTGELPARPPPDTTSPLYPFYHPPSFSPFPSNSSSPIPPVALAGRAHACAPRAAVASEANRSFSADDACSRLSVCRRGKGREGPSSARGRDAQKRDSSLARRRPRKEALSRPEMPRQGMWAGAKA